MFGKTRLVIGEQGARCLLEARKVAGQCRHDAIGGIACGAAFGGAGLAGHLDKPAQRDGGAARLRCQPVPMARQQGDFAWRHPQLRAAARPLAGLRHVADAGTGQHFGDAAARIDIDNGAGGVAENQQRAEGFGTSCLRSVQHFRDVGERTNGQTLRTIEKAMEVIGHSSIYPDKILLVNITRMKYEHDMSIDRKAAIASYKERKPAPGIYAIRCAATDDQWLGQAPDITSIRTRHWFSLKLGSHSNRAMQAAWNTHGEASFSLEALELLPEEDNPVTLSSQLRDALKRWRAELGAPAA